MGTIASKHVDWEYVEGITPQLVANVVEVTVSAANQMLLEYTAIYDFILYEITFYGTNADRKGLYFDNNLTIVMNHAANARPNFDVPIYIIKGTTLKITSIAAAAGTHGCAIWGRPLHEHELKYFKKKHLGEHGGVHYEDYHDFPEV